MEIKGKKAVIVGGASGMARASAELLSERGASVAILDLPDLGGRRGRRRRSGGTFHPVDVTDYDGRRDRRSTDAVEALGGLHIAVNTAGGGIAQAHAHQGGPAPARRVPSRRSSST